MLDGTWRSVASVVTVAEIYALIGDPEPALKTADAALRMINQMGASEKNQYPALLARAHAARGQSLNDLERFDEADTSFQKMLQIRKSRAREDRTGLLRALMQYANAAIGWNEYALAEKLLKQAQNMVDHDRDTATEDRMALAIKSLNLSTQDESTPIAGEKRLNALLALANKTLTPDAPDWIEVWMVISTFHYRYGRYDEALKYMDQSLYKSRAMYGERSTVTANGLGFRAALLNDLGRYQEALGNFDSLRAIQVSLRPDKAPLIAKIDGQRGGTLMLMGEFEKAAQASEAAIRGLPDTTPTYLRWRAIAMSNLARSQSRLGKHTEAVAAADRLMASLDSLPLSALDRAMASMSLSGIWLAAGRFDRVQFALDRAETGFRKLLPADHPGFMQVTQRRGELAEAQNNFAQAERHYSTALELLDRSQDNPSLRRDLMCAQVRMIYRLGDRKRAEQLSAQTLALVRTYKPDSAVSLSETNKMLAEARTGR
jgi:tetratricopeptide (TPR) repeat protein